MDLADYERLNPRCEVDWGGKTVLYATPNRATRLRVETLFTKEPCTLEWLNALGPADVLADVGANVGMYSVWAAAQRGARVYAFEPESQNYALLNRNIALNGLQDRVRAFCLALSDRPGVSALHVSDLAAGGSLHSYGEAVDFRLAPMQAAFAQGCVAATLDALVAEGAVEPPTHLKIDVDGLEHRVFAGARATIRDRRLRLVQVEINRNLAEHRAIVEALAAEGWRHDPAQVAAAERTSGAFRGVAEYVFRR